MPARRYEERAIISPMRIAGTVTPAEARAAARPVPWPQPQYPAGETRGQRAPLSLTALAGARGASSPHGAPHPPMSGTHIHEHHDYGQGTPPAPGQRLGIHIHEHEHHGDASHSPSSASGSHPHRVSGTPGNPDASMPAVQLNSGALGGEIRAGLEDLGLGAAIAAYLRAEGVDVERSLAEIGYRREHAGQHARAQAARAQDLARALKRAKRARDVAQDAWLNRWSGSSITEVGECRERVSQLETLLGEACCNDPDLIAEARRRAAL